MLLSYFSFFLSSFSEFGEICKHKSWSFNFTPESIAFYTLPSTAASSASASDDSTSSVEHELIIGLRGVPYLTYVNLQTMDSRTISVNENEWDTHVSFAPLYLSISPDQKYVLMATDKNMHIVMRVGTNRRVRTLTGHISGDYGKPYAVWDNTGKYIYCNSEEEHFLYVYSVASERVVEKLRGHAGIIRSLAVHPRKSIVSTASYDKTVAIWGTKG